MSRAEHDLGLAHAALWADTRIAVVDVETCRSDDGGRIVAVAVVTCRKGKPTVARLAWEAGCRDPRLVNVYAGLLAASGTTAALDQAISACDHALAGRGGDTDGGWRRSPSAAASSPVAAPSAPPA